MITIDDSRDKEAPHIDAGTVVDIYVGAPPFRAVYPSLVIEYRGEGRGKIYLNLSAPWALKLNYEIGKYLSGIGLIQK